jgi:hypothetical protein
VKHAGAAALDALEPVLAQLRNLEGLKEKVRAHFIGVPGRSCIFMRTPPDSLRT